MVVGRGNDVCAMVWTKVGGARDRTPGVGGSSRCGRGVECQVVGEGTQW